MILISIPLRTPQTLYSLLPALLDTNPFSNVDKDKERAAGQGAEGGEKQGGEGEEDDVSALPAKVARLVEVYRCSLVLSREACLSPPLTSQTFGYLFFFTNTSLLNTLLERGEKFLIRFFFFFTFLVNYNKWDIGVIILELLILLLLLLIRQKKNT